MVNNFKTTLIILSAVFLIGIFFSGTIYRDVIKKNKEFFPPFIEKLIDRRDARLKPSIPVFKPEMTIKILEGWTLDDVRQYLISESKINESDFDRIAGKAKLDYRESDLEYPYDFSEQFSFLKDKPKYFGLEGYLFPDTYRIFTDATSTDIIETMLKNFDSKLTPKMREDIAAQGRTIYEVVTMASLIEKEAPINYQDPENRDARLVSDIFWDRLENGQALQSDATLSYLLNDNNPSHSGKELEIDSLYNSYKHKGLPPTPISNPGLKAIEAAIYPIETNYNYFLTDLNGNNIYYAETYQEHLQNKYKYLK